MIKHSLVGAGPEWWASRAIEAQPEHMPLQDLRANAAREPRPFVEPNVGARLVRAAIIVLTLASAVAFATGQYEALALQNGGTFAHYLFLGLSTLAFTWMAFGAVNALTGAIAVLTGRRVDTVKPSTARQLPEARTALLFPVYHEDPADISRSISWLSRRLAQDDLNNRFDVFILSDTQSDEARRQEADCFELLAHELRDVITVVYRNRRMNTEKKVGNIADWVRTFGGSYPYFVVFDADSVMTSETLRCLVATIDENPDTGLIQTVPRLIGAQTLFGKLQQFACNLFGPVASAGFAAWQDASGNYWGHNAIIRTRAFAKSAGLPSLGGPAPFGGPIRSHDFVEAALLRRAGWRVSLMTTLSGSYEGAPPTLIEMAVRDRRWMQGNLQHLAVLNTRGLAPISRVHLLTGIISYVSSTIWLLMLGAGLWLIWQEQHRELRYFSDEPSLFPNWPTFNPEAGLNVLIGTVLVVLLPKIFGLAVALLTPSTQQVGGARTPTLVAGWFLEIVISALIAPIFMLLHVRYLFEILTGSDSGWKPQRRSVSTVAFGDCVRFHCGHVLIGIVIGMVAASLSWYAFLWLSPIILGLVISPALTWYTSKPASELESWLLSSPSSSADELHQSIRDVQLATSASVKPEIIQHTPGDMGRNVPVAT